MIIKDHGPPPGCNLGGLFPSQLEILSKKSTKCSVHLYSSPCLGPDQELVEEPQLSLFLDKNSKAHPCMDQSSHCQKWIENSPGSCIPRFEAKFGNARNSYSFMREVCQETCNQRVDSFRDSFRSDKCKQVQSNWVIRNFLFTLRKFLILVTNI